VVVEVVVVVRMYVVAYGQKGAELVRVFGASGGRMA